MFHAKHSYKNVLILFFSHVTHKFTLIFYSLNSNSIDWAELLSLIPKVYYVLHRLWIFIFYDNFGSHLCQLLLKVSGDEAAVSKAINVLVVWCWVRASHLLVLDVITHIYVASCFIYSVLPMTQMYRKLPQWDQISNIFWKYDAVSRPYAVRLWHHVLLTNWSCFCE